MISRIKKDRTRTNPWHRQGIDRNWTAISSHHVHTGVTLSSELSHLLTRPSDISLAQIVSATKLLKAYQNHHQAWADGCNRSADKAKKDQLKTSPHDREAYRHIAADRTTPLIALQRDDGSFVTNAIDINNLLIDK